MIEEVERLHQNGVSWEKLESFGLEYREVSRYLQGKSGRREMRDHLLVKIRQFAKRQDTWFRKMEREGVPIHWLAPDAIDEAEKRFLAFLQENSAN